jgi:hypothetical protein
VSSRAATIAVEIEDPITGVNLTASAHDVVQVGEVVTATVTVATGNNVTFDWLFGNQQPLTVNR